MADELLPIFRLMATRPGAIGSSVFASMEDVDEARRLETWLVAAGFEVRVTQRPGGVAPVWKGGRDG